MTVQEKINKLIEDGAALVVIAASNDEAHVFGTPKDSEIVEFLQTVFKNLPEAKEIFEHALGKGSCKDTQLH